ncbi:MAG: PilZ domain-containing protein [Myxococcota bacterium]
MERLLPEVDDDVLAQFRVDGTAVDAVLRELVRRRTMVTLFGAATPFTTTVEALGEGIMEAVLPLACADAAEVQQLVAVALLDEVKVQLAVRPLGLVTRRGELRLRLTRPDVVHRMQRRHGFRVRPLAGEPFACHLRTPGGRRTVVPILDISVVGVALAFPPDERPPPVGAELGRCLLHLVERQLVPCDLVVQRHEADAERTRVGCTLRPVSVAAEQALQRTIMDIELRRAG